MFTLLATFRVLKDRVDYDKSTTRICCTCTIAGYDILRPGFIKLFVDHRPPARQEPASLYPGQWSPWPTTP